MDSIFYVPESGHACILILLSSDIRSEGNIAVIKKFDYDFLIIFDSISFPHLKKVF